MSGSDDLKARQEAGERVEKRMLEMLLGFHPCADLRVSDIKTITWHARTIAFDEMAALAEGRK